MGIALARKGHTVTIFEQVPQMGEVGISKVYVLILIAEDRVGRCRDSNTAKLEQATLTMGPGAST